MAMDFFEHQDRARRRTGLLLFWFALAVVLTVGALNVAAYLAAAVMAQRPLTPAAWLQQPYWAWVTGGALLVIFAGSLVRYLSLLSGGEAIAKSVHARRVLPSTSEPRERVLLNVVEEMALASGTPAPTVWIMDDEPGINAFVAGFEPTRAVLVVTRGALDAFDREQLQGVVGHEFSHILNGDMRLNVQLYAVLAGILLIGKIGEFLLRNAGRVRGDRDSAKAIPVLLLAGLVLTVIGYAGLFCGRVIKAAISRQREFLADASSVQFTRNPRGIGEALLTIRGASHGSLLASAQAEDMSHMCIALPVRMSFAGLLATHPPLDERITAIDASLLARDRARRQRSAQQAQQAQRTVAGSDSPATSALAGDRDAPIPYTSGTDATGNATPAAVAALTASVGRPTPAHHDYALRLRDSLPASLRDLLRQEDGARVVTCGLFIAIQAPAHEADALQQVAATEGEAIAASLRAALPELRRLGSRLQLPCIDLALPALRALPADARTRLLATLAQLAQLDRRIALREYLWLSVLRRQLAPEAPARRPVRHRSYRTVVEPLNAVLSLLCHAAGGSAGARVDLHARLLAGFGAGVPAMLPPSALGADRLHAALTELADLSPLLKKPLLDACLDAVRHDGRVQVAEIELVRAIGEALDCPVPPLVG